MIDLKDFQGFGNVRVAKREAVETGTDQDVLAHATVQRLPQRILGIAGADDNAGMAALARRKSSRIELGARKARSRALESIRAKIRWIIPSRTFLEPAGRPMGRPEEEAGRGANAALS
jgi:hypothetical protein